jgi:dephospho-CoA kinase
MKVFLLGHGRSGKDLTAEILRDRLGLTFCSSSLFMAKVFIYDALKNAMGYASFEECYEDRHNHRATWHELICSYNAKDPAKLSREIFKEYDIYVGIRSNVEFEEARREDLVDIAIWIDASDRVPEEGKESFNIDRSQADFVIDNNGTEGELRARIDKLIKLFSLS